MTAGAITSTGGFAGPYYPSDLFSRPAWQEKAVQRYVAENNASTFDAFPTDSTPGYNPSGRAYPDISMYWAFFPVLYPGGRLYQDEVRSKGLELLPDGSYRGSPTTPPKADGQTTASLSVLVVTLASLSHHLLAI